MELTVSEMLKIGGVVVTLVAFGIGLEWRIRFALKSDEEQDEKIRTLQGEDVPQLRKDLEEGLRTLRERASDSHADLHNKIDGVRDRVSRLEGRVDERGPET